LWAQDDKNENAENLGVLTVGWDLLTMATAKNNPLSSTRIIRVASLIGPHSKLQKIIKKLGYSGGGPFPINTAITRAAIDSTLELMPIHVTSQGEGKGHERYWVIGGLRQFVLVKHLLQPDDEIPVLITGGRVNPDKMFKRFAVEYCLLPTLLGNLEHKEVLDRINEVSIHLPGVLKPGSRDELAQLLGVSLRTVAAHNAKKHL
jgi:hypothetical protein